LQASAAGHWGTLDPAACGVLVLAIGRATRLLPLLPHARKQYVFELILGSKTDSGDSTGRVVQRAGVQADWRVRLPLALRSMLGVIKQIPPMHSALKVEGRALYRSARAGVEIPRSPRQVRIYALHPLVKEELPASGDAATTRVRLFVECDAGTYVRVLCEDLGRELGLPAHMGMLVRVGAGEFRISESMPPHDLERLLAAAVIDPLAVLRQQRCEVDATTARRFVHGNEISAGCAHVADDETLVVHAGRVLGSGQTFARDGRTLLAPVRVLADPEEIV